MTPITVISSTNRNNSFTFRVADTYQQLLIASGNDVRFFSLKDLPQDFIFSCFNGKSVPAFDQVVAEFIKPAEKIVFIIPEYNGGYPGILKAFIDCIKPVHFAGKKAALVGVADGHAGALRPIDHFTLILNHIKVNVYHDKPKLSNIEDYFPEAGVLADVYLERLKKQAEGFLKF
ncbi:MAG: NADPH-dependent FMN reductase [Flavobacteriales bacterium]